MKEKILYAIWACFYILCVGLGTLTQITPAGKVVLVILSLLFFLPGALLLKEALDTQHRAGLIRIRVICLTSLFLTLILLVANIASANTASAETGAVLFDLLLLASAPMICAQYWVLSLFCWACLLIASFPKLWKPRTTGSDSSAGRK